MTTDLLTTPHSLQLVVTGIEPDHADALRAQGGPMYLVDEHPGYPCRQCLRDADVGEQMVLVSYDPFDRSSPYRSASPIFLHAQSCTSTVTSVPVGEGLPTQLTDRTLSVRAFDRADMMTDAAIIEGRDLASTITRFFVAEATDHIHVHNAVRGCWAARVNTTQP